MSESPEDRDRRLERYRTYYQENKKKLNQKAKQWRAENPDRNSKLNREWSEANKEHLRAYSKNKRLGLIGLYSSNDGPGWQDKNRQCYLEAKRESTNRRRQDIFMEALQHYGGENPCCYCCGESIPKLLCFDHINGGGNEHRKDMKGTRIYVWAKRNGWPEILRVACHSCNMGSHLNNGVCPHQEGG